MTTPSTRSLEIAAQAWCQPETSGIEMDSRLAVAFATILDGVIAEELSHRPPSREALQNTYDALVGVMSLYIKPALGIE